MTSSVPGHALTLLLLVTSAVPTQVRAQSPGIPLRLDERLLASTFDPALPPGSNTTTAGANGRPEPRAALVARTRKRGPLSRLMVRIQSGKRQHEVWIGDFALDAINATRLELDGKGVAIVSILMSDFTERWFEIRRNKNTQRYEIARRHRGRFGGKRPGWAAHVL